MRIGLYHGYELTGSGSNEYTRYLAQNLAGAGHQVHLICREEHPQALPFVTAAYAWQLPDRMEPIFSRTNQSPPCVLHQLPQGKVRPVYLTDKQRPGNVKAFTALTEQELADYHALNETLLNTILSRFELDLLQANHLVYQPVAALDACRRTRTPLIIYPHGSAIEYTVKPDRRYWELARDAVSRCKGLIIGNREVKERILGLYPDERHQIEPKVRIVGVGVDTSLFQPVDRSERPTVITHLKATGGGGGKPPQLSDELKQHLDTGDLEAVRGYWNRYDHDRPDRDFDDKLNRIPWTQPIVLFVGALTAGKGLHSLIAAMPAVLQHQPEAQLVIVGSGTYREVLEGLIHAAATDNQPLLEQLCAAGMNLDRSDLTGPWTDLQAYLSTPKHSEVFRQFGRRLPEQVHFLGRLDHSRLRFVFPCADLAVFPSIVPEAYPLVVMESLANGVLPLVSYFSGFKDSVDELRPLIGARLNDLMKIPVTPDGRIETIAAGLGQLLEDQSYIGLKPQLRQIAVEQFDWQLRAQQMVEAYRSLIAPQ